MKEDMIEMVDLQDTDNKINNQDFIIINYKNLDLSSIFIKPDKIEFNKIITKYFLKDINYAPQLSHDLLKINKIDFSKGLTLKNFTSSELAKNILKESSFNIMNSDAYIPKQKIFTWSSFGHKRAKNKIIVMTEVAWGTLGDYYAAEKCIQAMKKAYPKFEIQWIVMNHENSYLPQNAGSAADSFVAVKSWDELLDRNFSGQRTKPLFWFKNAALVFQFPTFHFLPPAVECVIGKCLPENSPILQCLEYDYTTKVASKGVVQAGLRDDAIGIFINKLQLESVNAILDNLQETKVGQFLLTGTDSRTYEQSNLCFFAYFNKDFTRVSNEQANAQNFCDIVATYTAKQHLPQKTLDVICRMTVDQMICFNPNKIFRENVNSITFMVDKQSHVLQNPYPSANGRAMRIYSEFPFPSETFQQLMRLAYQSAVAANITPFIGCTGDQSLSEVLSLSGAVPFYQVMGWKIHLFNALKDITKNNSTASKFMHNLTPLASSSSFIDDMAHLLCLPLMQNEWKEIHEFIIKHKNLYVNLPKTLSDIIHQQHPLLDDTEIVNSMKFGN